MIRVRHYRSRDRYEYFMYTQFFPSSHYPTDFSSLPIFSIYFAYLFDRQNRIISRLILHAILLPSSWSNNYTAACKREIETIIENFPVDRSMLVMALRNFSRFQGPIFYRTKKDHPFFPFFSFLRRTQRRRTLFNGLTEPLRSKNLPPSLSVPRSYGIIIHLFIIPRFISETRCLIHACSAEIAGVPIIQRFRGQQQWTPYVRCLQQKLLQSGKKKGRVSQIFRGRKLGCANSRHAWIRACVSLSLSLSVPSLFRKACHQSTRCIVYVRARGDASRMLCFELCTPRAHRAQIPSLDNIDDTQRERMRGRTHSVAANFSLLAHSFRIDSSINLRSNSSNLLDYRPIFFHEKEKKETKKENIFLSYIYIKARNRIILFSNTLSIARSFSSRGKLRKEGAGKKKRGKNFSSIVYPRYYEYFNLP